jgi:hypothetical protein
MNNQHLSHQIPQYTRVLKAACLALLLVLVSLTVTACAEKKVGLVTNFGQSIPAGGGMVQSFVTVKLDDSTELRAWLPQDDKIWNMMRTGAKSGKIRVEVQREGEFWKFVQVLP